MSERDDIHLTPEEEQRIQASVRALGEVRADDAFRARLREQFLSGTIPAAAEPAPEIAAPDGASPGLAAAEAEAALEPASPPQIVALPSRRPGRRAWALAALPALAAVLAFVFLGGGEPEWRLQGVRGDGRVVIAGQAVDASARTDLSRLVTDGARYEVGEGVEMDLVLGDIMVVGVHGPTTFELAARDAAAPDRFEARVEGGEFRFKSGPAFRGHEMVIRTSEGDAHITGTTVAVYKDPDVTCVCVLEGTARIGRDGEHMDAVPAGMRKVMFADGSAPKVIPIEPGHRDGLIEFEGYNRDTFR
ncbi:FecR domain-containing protein [bacterium]|nr:FecR domain-containing protein [bacterium]